MRWSCCLFLLLSGALATLADSDYPDPAVEQRLTRTIAPEQLRPGQMPPQISGGILQLTAGEDTASSAALPEKFDCSKGIRFEFEMCPDARQSNPFPRILEGPAASVQLVKPDPNEKEWTIKILSASSEGTSQAITKLDFTPGTWYRIMVRLDPARQMMSIQVNNQKEVFASLPEPFRKNSCAEFVFGNVNCNRKSQRGFSGKIRNIKVIAPYQVVRQVDFKAAGPSPTPLAHAGEVVRYITAMALADRKFYFPGFAVLKDGSYAAVSREAEDHVCPYGRIVFARSLDQGKNWSVPVSVADGPGDERDPALQQLPDGRLLLTWRDALSWNEGDAAKRYIQSTNYIRQSGTKLFKMFYMFSRDQGSTWEQPIEVPGFSPHGPAFYQESFYQPTIALRDGKRYIDLWKGSADARNWEKIGTIAESPQADPGTIQEPHLAVLKDGTMVCAIRIHSDGYMRIARSTDSGRSWSPMVKTPVRGFPQHLLQLPDGRLLATYGYRYYPLGVRACFSSDGGLTWDMAHEVILRDRGLHGDLGYPVSVLLADGRIATCYYYNTSEHSAPFVEVAVWKP